MKYLYNTGLVIGRFQCFHRGHEFLIKQALSLCRRVVIYVGSAQSSGTKDNPFSYTDRKDLITKVFKKEIKRKRVFIYPLNDIGVGNQPSWGEYILNCIKNDFGCLPNLYITGCEKERSSWFTNNIAPDMDELRLTRHNINISASDCRACLPVFGDGFDKWRELVPYPLYDDYFKLAEKYHEIRE